MKLVFPQYLLLVIKKLEKTGYEILLQVRKINLNFSRNTKFSQNLIDLDVRLLTNYYKSLGFYDVKIISNTAQINKDAILI